MATKLNIIPNHLTVGQLFGTNLIFRLPKYQRYYAWTVDEIDDFLKDVESSRLARARGASKSHFFGGLVTVLKPVPGSPRQNHEVIDGQQRLATFLMLVVQLRRAMVMLAQPLNKKTQFTTFLVQKSKALESQFESFNDTVDLKVVKIPRLELSEADKDYFAKLLGGSVAKSSRKSHILLHEAFTRIGEYLSNVVAACPTLKEKVKALAGIVSVIEEDWTVIHMATQTRSDAYMLFQVLNDRGLGLTEGELLRAKTLELLDEIGTASQKESVEQNWDLILATDSERVEEGLRWLYASHKGTRPGKASLFDDCLDLFFPMHARPQPIATDAAVITSTVERIKTEFLLITRLLDGQWPYELVAPVTQWDADRLRLLVVELKHTNCMPLLLASALLTQKKFSEIVHMLEKFVFRYKVMMNAHIGPATSLYQRQAVAIRAIPAQYKVSVLKHEIETLIAAQADDAKFAARIGELEYSLIASNKPLKYFLLTVEHYAVSVAKKSVKIAGDKSRIFDFANATIEHVYPANANPKTAALEPFINSIGNLTILGQEDNDAAGNKSFVVKCEIFRNSSMWMNREIASVKSWTPAALASRKKKLIEMALKIFVP